MRPFKGCSLAFCLLFQSCLDERTEPVDVGISLPEAVFAHIEDIALEEPEGVINVAPSVAVNADGTGFFIVDQQEARARLYAPDGRLIQQFGSRGSGPGEFMRPVAGYRWDAETLVVGDMRNGLIRFRAPGAVLRTSEIRLRPLYGLLPVSATRALLVGRLPESGDNSVSLLLHLWDLEADSIVHSFFPTPGDSITRLAARNFGWAGAAVRADTIAAVAALSDTLYLFHVDGRLLNRIPLTVPGFRRPTGLPGADTDPVRLEEWLSQHVFLNSVFALPDGTFLIQSERPTGRESRWSLVRTDAGGRTIFQFENTPRLLAVRGEQLIFQSPEAETPDRWRLVRLR